MAVKEGWRLPAGKENQIGLNVMNIAGVFDRAPYRKLKAEKGPKIRSALSVDLREGMSIAVDNGIDRG